MEALKTAVNEVGSFLSEEETLYLAPWTLDREPDIKNIMTGWANKKPFGDIIFLIEHRMKTIFVTTCRADLKLGIHFNSFNFVIHTILLQLEN